MLSVQWGVGKRVRGRREEGRRGEDKVWQYNSTSWRPRKRLCFTTQAWSRRSENSVGW